MGADDRTATSAEPAEHARWDTAALGRESSASCVSWHAESADRCSAWAGPRADAWWPCATNPRRAMGRTASTRGTACRTSAASSGHAVSESAGAASKLPAASCYGDDAIMAKRTMWHWFGIPIVYGVKFLPTKDGVLQDVLATAFALQGTNNA
jgi:hypothetical protein